MPLLEKIFSFCEKHGIEKLNMTDPFINPKNRRQKRGFTYEHYYSYNCFNVVVDMQLAEFDDHFNEVNSELLICMAALDSRDSFSGFDSLQLMRLVNFYLDDFSSMEKIGIEHKIALDHRLLITTRRKKHCPKCYICCRRFYSNKSAKF